jgi:hypothetical protein
VSRTPIISAGLIARKDATPRTAALFIAITHQFAAHPRTIV